MSSRKTFFILLILYLFSLVHAQTPEKIIGKYVKAIGGQKALDTIRTLKYVRKFTHTDSGKTNRITCYYKKPHFFRWESGNGKRIWVSVGTIQWRGSRDSLERQFQWDEGRPIRRKPFILEPLGIFLNSELDVKFEYVGKEIVGDKEAHHISMIFTKDSKSELFFDVKTGLLVKTMTGKRESRFGIMIECFSDYRPVGDILFPFRVEATRELPDGKKNHQINTMLKVEINVPLDDNLFKIDK